MMKIMAGGLLLMASFGAIAGTGANERSGGGSMYLGINYHGTVTAEDWSGELDLGPGYAMLLGYSYYLSETYRLDTELEYLNMGSASRWGTNSTGTFTVNHEGSGITLYAKPTYESPDNGLYASVLFGIGSYNLERDIKVKTSSGGAGRFDRFDGIGYSAGLEAGYEFGHIVGSVGYKIMHGSLDNINVDFSTVYFGAKYRF